MKVGDLVYAQNFVHTSGIIVSAIGVIREINNAPYPYNVWFPDLGYGVSFKEDELTLLEDYYADR